VSIGKEWISISITPSIVSPTPSPRIKTYINRYSGKEIVIRIIVERIHEKWIIIVEVI
jgi:hypothetical protein